MVNVDYKPHQDLESEAGEYLTAKGFYVESVPYHEKFADEVKDKLQNVFTPTALYLRGRSDQIAIHKEKDLVFEWEVKTHESKKYHDICIEMLPIAHHLSKSKLDVRCLYVYRDTHNNEDYGFWIKQMPEIRQIMIPNRWDGELKMWFEKIADEFFPKIPVHNPPWYGGSGDPYLIIDEKEKLKLKDWKTLIEELF